MRKKKRSREKKTKKTKKKKKKKKKKMVSFPIPMLFLRDRIQPKDSVLVLHTKGMLMLLLVFYILHHMRITKKESGLRLPRLFFRAFFTVVDKDEPLLDNEVVFVPSSLFVLARR